MLDRGGRQVTKEFRLKIWDMNGRAVTDEKGNFKKLKNVWKGVEEKYK